MNLEQISKFLPEVKKPFGRITLKTRLTWTLIILVIYFAMAMTPLYGVDPNYKAQYEIFSVLLAANFGTLLTLGIGPIITGAIMAEVLVGADIIKVDLKTHEGRREFQQLQRWFSILFIFIENGSYVFSGALHPMNSLLSTKLIMFGQLVAAGYLLMLMDEISSKWGIGSGISLFIAAGVSRQIISRAINPLSYGNVPAGAIPAIMYYVSIGLGAMATPYVISILATIVVFMVAVYFSNVQATIPLSLGTVRYRFKWPIKWFYTSNIPVILTASLIAVIQILGSTLYAAGIPLLGTYEMDANGHMVPVSGLVKYLNPPKLQQLMQGVTTTDILSILFYALFMIAGATIFSYLWLQIGGQDPSSVADQILASGFTIPGYRADKRILERVLSRYIIPLAILGGITVGILATFADILGALSRGTGILLTVMIMYTFYENMKRQYMEEMNPMVRKVLG